MKTRNLLERLSQFLDKDLAAQRTELESIRDVLKKLKQKEKKLRQKLDEQPDPEDYQEISAKLEVVHAQRLKGLERVKQLRDNARDPTPDKDTSPQV